MPNRFEHLPRLVFHLYQKQQVDPLDQLLQGEGDSFDIDDFIAKVKRKK